MTVFPVNHSVLTITNPTLKVQGKWMVLCVVPGCLAANLCGRVEFRSRDRTEVLRDGHAEIQRQKAHYAE